MVFLFFDCLLGKIDFSIAFVVGIDALSPGSAFQIEYSVGAAPFLILLFHAVHDHVECHSNHAVNPVSGVGHFDLAVKEIVSVGMDIGLHASIIVNYSPEVNRLVVFYPALIWAYSTEWDRQYTTPRLLWALLIVSK